MNSSLLSGIFNGCNGSTDLRAQILNQEAAALETTSYGQLYEIRAPLVGPSGRTLRVRTIWMTEYLSGATKFITLIPD
jgi:hypothetical protein